MSATDPSETLFRILACAEKILDGDDSGEEQSEASLELASKVFELHDWLRTGHELPDQWRMCATEEKR